MNKQRIINLAAFLGLLLFTAGTTLHAAPITWNGSEGDEDWFTSDNWTPAGVPQATDDVILSSGSILLTNETVALNSFSMSGGTLVFSNWTSKLEASQIEITGGEVSLPSGFSNSSMSNRIWFVGENFTLTNSGTINADGGGFLGNNGPGVGVYGSAGSGGGGHGGVGNGGNNGVGGIVNGTADNPGPGSGGGNKSPDLGGAGGGVVCIEMTGSVSINGVISANGQDSDVLNGTGNARSGGGSGGGILISGNTIGGSSSGVIRANGGYGARYGGSGGGGRIALLFDTTAQAAVAEKNLQFSVSSKTGTYKYPGDIGSLYLSDTAALNGLSLRHTGELIMPGTNWVMNSWHIYSGWLRINDDSVTLSIANDVIIDGSSTLFDFRGASLACGGDLLLTNGGDFAVYASATNGTSESPDYGSLVDVSGSVSVGSGSWISPHSHIYNGGSPLFRMGSLNIESTGGFNANSIGFSGGITTHGDKNGYGPGKGESSFSNAGGAGYGGLGGRCKDNTTRGSLYGDTERPTLAGSGGASVGQAAGRRGGYGGGLIRLEIDGNMTLQGTLTANGQYAPDTGGGGGSGGGIFVQCRSYTASIDSVLSASGANGNGLDAGGGAGGRIALWYGGKMEGEIDYDLLTISSDPADFDGTVTLTGGTGYETDGSGDAGTFRLVEVEVIPEGTMIIIN